MKLLPSVNAVVNKSKAQFGMKRQAPLNIPIISSGDVGPIDSVDASPPEGSNRRSCPSVQPRSEGSEPVNTQQRKNNISPIALRYKSGWCNISAEIRRKGYNFLKAQNIVDGIRVFPATETDFRHSQVLHERADPLPHVPTPVGEDTEHGHQRNSIRNP